MRVLSQSIPRVVPLCAGWAETPALLQWQTLQESRRNDVAERRWCRALRRSAAGAAAEQAADFGIRRQDVVVGGEDGVADGLDNL
ncbi:MAG: hypothetical protein AW07_03006 [Candidatus Accumulibacter sp. SK-11]|nr:MAG: hypothetical protein AW07_03006 [Candidatus Accumulibacter sp. SK-11]